MPQTIWAFLAMLVTTLLAINQHRTVLRSYEGMLNDAVEVMSSGVALQALEYIARQEFDAAVSGSAFVTSPTQLQNGPFSNTKNCDLTAVAGVCTDIDDFDGMSPDTLTVVTREGDTFEFSVTAEVFYVDQNLNPDSSVTYNTYAKMVVVEVRDAYDIMNHPAHLSRLVVCGPVEGCN